MPNGDIYEIIYKNDGDVKLLEKSIFNNNNDYFMKKYNIIKICRIRKVQINDKYLYYLIINQLK